MTDNKVTPYDVAQWSVRNGYRCEGNGSYHSLIPNGGEHYGLTVDKIGRQVVSRVILRGSTIFLLLITPYLGARLPPAPCPQSDRRPVGQ